MPGLSHIRSWTLTSSRVRPVSLQADGFPRLKAIDMNHISNAMFAEILDEYLLHVWGTWVFLYDLLMVLVTWVICLHIHLAPLPPRNHDMLDAHVHLLHLHILVAPESSGVNFVVNQVSAPVRIPSPNIRGNSFDRIGSSPEADLNKDLNTFPRQRQPMYALELSST